MEKKEKQISKEKKEIIQNLTTKQKDEFIKQFEKQHIIVRLNRVSDYENRIRAEKNIKKTKKIG